MGRDSADVWGRALLGRARDERDQARRWAVALEGENAYLRDLCAKIIEVHAAVRMDTPEDIDLHARAVETFRAALTVPVGGLSRWTTKSD